MDRAKVFVVLVDDDGEMDAQVFQSEQDAQTYCVELVLSYLSENPDLDDVDDDPGMDNWTDAITGLGDPSEQYAVAIQFLNDYGIDDLGVLIVERHIHRKVWD